MGRTPAWISRFARAVLRSASSRCRHKLCLDEDVTLGYVIADEAIAFAATQPTLSVAATLESDPQILLWDPATHPTFTTITDIGQTDTKVVYYQGAIFMDYLVGSGILRKSQVDGSYDGSPARFAADGGDTVLQGYATKVVHRVYTCYPGAGSAPPGRRAARNADGR